MKRVNIILGVVILCLMGTATVSAGPASVSLGQGLPVVMAGQNVAFQQATPVAVAIDIHPGSWPNAINARRQGVIPVAILGSEDFDVRNIDPTTLRFEDMPLAERGHGRLQYSYEDVSGDFSMSLEGAPDGWEDMVCHFIAPLWEGNEETATVTGNLWDGSSFSASDSIKLIFR